MNADAGPNAVTLNEVANAAKKAQDEKKFDMALSAWERVRATFPESPLGYSGSAVVLAKLNRPAEAAAILSEGLARFPGNEKIAVEHAWLAHHASDWPEADRRWTAVRTRFPDALAGYFGGGATLRFLGRLDEADAMYRTAIKQWPGASNLLADYAAVAQSRGDVAEASRRWQVLRNAFPDEPSSYLREARELRATGRYDEAEPILLAAIDRFPDNARPLVEYAQLAQQRGQTAQALKRWDTVATRFHGLVDGYVGAAQCLNDLSRFADAQAVLQPALRMFPDSAEVATLSAWTAHYLADFTTAVERWADIRRRFPGNVVGYTGAGTTLLALHRDDEAEALIGQAIVLFPNNVHVAMDYARLPQHKRDWDEAQRRWAAIHQRFPSAAKVMAGYCQMLVTAERWDQAETLLQAAVTQHGGEMWALRSFAESATHRADWPAAEARWRRVTERFPDRPGGWTGLADMLRSAGRLDECKALLARAIQLIPDNVDLERQRAQIATLRRDWPEALRLWDDLRRKHPRHQGVLNAIKQALWQARQDLGVAANEGNPAPFEIPPALLAPDEEDTADLRELFMQFESIGDTCEFGIVQRRFGAEPISLLRWASIPPARLVQALDSRFVGVGDADNTVVAVIHGEYTTRDKRYHMFSHTFTPEIAESLEVFTKQHLRRMQYLRRKLIDDLTEGDKIFVYKSINGLSDDEARAIYRAILGYGGKQALLCVRLEDQAHPRGTLERYETGLFIGYIDRFSTVDINVDIWVELCRKAQAAWKATHGSETRQPALT